MKTSDYLPWFERILGDFQKIQKTQAVNYNPPAYFYNPTKAQEWAVEAGSALTAVFPPAHYCCGDWIRLAPQMRPMNCEGERWT